MSKPTENIVNVFITLRGGDGHDRDAVAAEIERSARLFAKAYGLRLDVACEEETDILGPTASESPALCAGQSRDACP